MVRVGCSFLVAKDRHLKFGGDVQELIIMRIYKIRNQYNYEGRRNVQEGYMQCGAL